MKEIKHILKNKKKMSYVSKLINYLKNINKKIKKTCHVSKIKVEKKTMHGLKNIKSTKI